MKRYTILQNKIGYLYVTNIHNRHILIKLLYYNAISMLIFIIHQSLILSLLRMKAAGKDQSFSTELTNKSHQL